MESAVFELSWKRFSQRSDTGVHPPVTTETLSDRFRPCVTQKIEKNLRAVFFPPALFSPSRRTPGQITSQLSEQKPESNSLPGEKRGRSNCRDLA